MPPKSVLSVHGSIPRLWIVLSFTLTLWVDAATVQTSGKQRSEVLNDRAATVRRGRLKGAAGRSSQLIRKEGAKSEDGESSSKRHFDLLVLIPASWERDQTRIQTIRDTWTKDIDKMHLCRRCGSNRTVKYLFMLGEEAEGVSGDDIVVLPRCSSAYEELAEKVKRSIHYAVQHYNFKLLLKADTDSWIFLDRLLRFAEDHRLFDSRRSVQAGEVRRKGRPQRSDGKNPDGVFTTLTGQETYPVYSPGCGYLLTRNLCNYISLLASEDTEPSVRSKASEASLPVLQDLPQEDVSVGFWLEAVEHEHLSMPLSIMGDACRKADGQSLVLDHYVSEEEMQRRWRNLQHNGDPCQEADGSDS